MIQIERRGMSPAVCPYQGTWASARLEAGWVVVEVNGGERFRIDVGPMRSLSIGCRPDGALWVAGALEGGGGDTAYLVTATSVINTGRHVVQQRGVYLTPDACRLAVCESGRACIITDLDTPWRSVTSLFPGVGTTAGILGIDGDEALWAEDLAGGYVKRHGLTLPRDAGPWTFGQMAGPDDAGAWHDGVLSTLVPGQTYEQSAAWYAEQAAVVGVELADDRVTFVVVPPWPVEPDPGPEPPEPTPGPEPPEPGPTPPEPIPIPPEPPNPEPPEEPIMPFTSITNAPILCNKPDAGYSSAEQTPHQDHGYVGVRITEGQHKGKWRFVSDHGDVEDTRDSAGAGERFEVGVGGTTMIARRNGVPFVFPVS